MKKNNVNMLKGSITKGLLSMSIPIMIMNVMQSLFNIMDMTALKYFSDDRAVGAVGASSTLISLCTGLLIGIAAGANVIVAKRIGQDDKESTDKAAMTSILLSFVCGFILMIAGVIFAETFLKMTNCPESLLKPAVLYFKLYFYGTPALMLYNFSAALLRAIGDTKRPMYFLILGGILKVLFTVLFAAVFDMTVEGVGYATIISNIVAGGLTFYTLLKNKDTVHINFKETKFDIKELKAILFVGVPTGLQSVLYSFANVLLMTTVNSFGADATTGISIANQFDGILYQIIHAPSLAATPYVAQNIGACNIKRARQAFVRAVFITSAFGATFGSLSAIFSVQLSSIMSSTPSVIEFSRQKMIIISSTYFISGINEVLGGVLRGMGKPVYPTVTALIFQCLFRFFWVFKIFPLCPNLTFLYLVWPVSWILSIITNLIAYFPRISKLNKQSLSVKQNITA